MAIVSGIILGLAAKLADVPEVTRKLPVLDDIGGRFGMWIFAEWYVTGSENNLHPRIIKIRTAKTMDEKFQKILDDIKRSTKEIEVLPSDPRIREQYKKTYQINPQSLIGTILENTGGIIIENWLRLYGTGPVDFVTRNSLFPFEETVIGEDVLGGLFICLEHGGIGYFAPDTLELEDMEIGMGQFLYWCLHGDTDTFYTDYRWENWKKELAGLNYDKGVAFYPFLWADAESLESRKREILPIEEIICLEFDFLQQISGKI